MLKLINIIGARPQFIKVVSLSMAIKEFNKRYSHTNSKIKEITIHTGQHYDYNMNDIFFKDLDLKKPDYSLGVGSYSQGKQTAMMLEGIEKVLKIEVPDLVLVYGDTNSTLAGALAAKKMHILLAHIEAGLRSYNMNAPEEINRVITDRISDILFCPSKNAIKNLALEGIMNSTTKRFPKIFLVGDVMYDSILYYLKVARKRSDILKKLSLTPKGYYLATVHRAENTDDRARLESILRCLVDIAKNRAPVIFPIHPRTKKAMKRLKFKYPSDLLRIIEPASYLDMLILEKNAKAILTDSGGVQKEAYFLDIPCVTLRGETEWVETIRTGFNVLAGTDRDRIEKALNRVIKLNLKLPQIYGNGQASIKIVKIIHSLLKNA